MNILDYINGLEIPGGRQPVSFAMHCNIGRILDREMETDIDNLDVKDMELLDSSDMPFIP